MTQTQGRIPANLEGKKIVFITHSDSLGGAAIVTFRLMQALRKAGLDARMVVYTKETQSDSVSVVGTRFVRGLAFCLERLRILAATGWEYGSVFKVSTGDFAINVDRNKWVKEADIVCLGWFNQGLLGLTGIERLGQAGKKIVWTMHDMWAMTGICHHAHECTYYLDQCGNCRYLAGGGRPNDISHRYWMRKDELYNRVSITFVAVSRWLEQKARSSSLLRTLPVMTIHNPFPAETFYTHPHPETDPIFSDYKKNIILFGAARIDDPIKGLDYAIDALNIIFDNNPDVAAESAIYFFGAMKHPEALDRLRFSHRWLGKVSDERILRYLYASAKVVLSTSLYETLGGTLVEGQAAGALPVTFGGDGREDVVEHKVNGYIARYKDPADVAEGILWAIDADVDRDELHASVEERFGADAIADKYIQLFSSLYADE